MRLALLLAAAVAITGCAGGGDVGEPVATDRVDLPRSYRFEPAAITVPAGTTVTWTNNDQFTHNVRLLDDGGEVLVMAPGESVSFTFTEPGLHEYDCSFHATDMNGSVLVTEASAQPPALVPVAARSVGPIEADRAVS